MNELNRVTGKQVLTDAVTLVKDTGLFVFDLGRLIVYKVKTAVREHEKKRADEKTDVIAAQSAG